MRTFEEGVDTVTLPRWWVEKRKKVAEDNRDDIAVDLEVWNSNPDVRRKWNNRKTFARTWKNYYVGQVQAWTQLLDEFHNGGSDERQ